MPCPSHICTLFYPKLTGLCRLNARKSIRNRGAIVSSVRPAYPLQLNSYQTQKTVVLSSLEISVPISQDIRDSSEAPPKRIRNHGLIFSEARRAISFSTSISRLDALTGLKPRENTLVVSEGACYTLRMR